MTITENKSIIYAYLSSTLHVFGHRLFMMERDLHPCYFCFNLCLVNNSGIDLIEIFQNTMEQNWTHSSGSTPQFVEAQSLSYTLGAILLLLTILWKNFQSDGTKRRLTFWMSRNLARTTTDSQLGGLEAIGGPKPFPIKLIGNLFHFWPIRSKYITNFCQTI